MSNTLSGRIHGMDALRAIAMLLGLVLHAAIAYRVHPNNAWPDDSFQWIGYDFLYYWIHCYRMQLFYLVAGFFANFLVLKIGERPFLKHRFDRIVVPFIASLVIIVPLSFAPFLYYKAVYGEAASHQEAIRQVQEYFIGWLTLRDTKGIVHIWFLYYLLIFYGAMMVGIWGWKWIEKWEALGTAIRGLEKHLNFASPVFLLALSLPLFAILLTYPGISVEPYTGLKPSIPHVLYYGYFFLLGWLIYRQASVLQTIPRLGWAFAITGTLLVFPMMWLHGVEDVLLASRSSIEGLGGRFLGAVQTILLTFGMLGLFLRLFSKESRALRYVSDAAYWLYLAHLPLVAGMQVAFLDSPIPGFLRFWVILGVTTLLTLGSYHLFVRYTFIGNVLHGPRGKNLKAKLAKS